MQTAEAEIRSGPPPRSDVFPTPLFIKRFDDITIRDIPTVGGKTASLGEMFRELAPQGVKVPDGGQAPSDYPEFAQFLVEQGIDSISLNPDSVLTATLAILNTEQQSQEENRR